MFPKSVTPFRCVLLTTTAFTPVAAIEETISSILFSCYNSSILQHKTVLLASAAAALSGTTSSDKKSSHPHCFVPIEFLGKTSPYWLNKRRVYVHKLLVEIVGLTLPSENSSSLTGQLTLPLTSSYTLHHTPPALSSIQSQR